MYHLPPHCSLLLLLATFPGRRGAGEPRGWRPQRRLSRRPRLGGHRAHQPTWRLQTVDQITASLCRLYTSQDDKITTSSDTQVRMTKLLVKR